MRKIKAFDFEVYSSFKKKGTTKAVTIVSVALASYFGYMLASITLAQILINK